MISFPDTGSPGFRGKRSLWALDGAIAAGLFPLLVCLQPAMPDGDGLGHASRALNLGFLEGMDPKHPLYAPFLRCLYKVLAVFGLQKLAIDAFQFASHLAGVGTFLALARGIYPLFITRHLITSVSALGTVLSYGLLSRSVIIETYAPAVFMNVALVAWCLRMDVRRPCAAATAGLLFVLATGVHVTSILSSPFIIVLLVLRAGRSIALLPLLLFLMTALIGLGIIFGLAAHGRDALPWLPNPALILPRGEPHPTLGLPGRIGRAVYGMARTVAWLPPVRQLSYPFAAGYCVAMLAALLSVLYVVRGRFARQYKARRGLLGMATLLVLPYGLMGLYYFPSDPERWVFLLPLFWLFIGMIWDQYRPAQDGLLTPRAGVFLLIVLVSALGVYNAAYKLLPETRSNRDLAGLQELARILSPNDLVISPGGVTDEVYAFFLDAPLKCENVTIMSMVTWFESDQAALQNYLRSLVIDRLRNGERVYAHNLIGEGHRKGENYPWAHFTRHDLGPETFLSVLEEFAPRAIISPTPGRTGTFRLGRPGE